MKRQKKNASVKRLQRGRSAQKFQRKMIPTTPTPKKQRIPAFPKHKSQEKKYFLRGKIQTSAKLFTRGPGKSNTKQSQSSQQNLVKNKLRLDIQDKSGKIIKKGQRKKSKQKIGIELRHLRIGIVGENEEIFENYRSGGRNPRNECRKERSQKVYHCKQEKTESAMLKQFLRKNQSGFDEQSISKLLGKMKKMKKKPKKGSKKEKRESRKKSRKRGIQEDKSTLNEYTSIKSQKKAKLLNIIKEKLKNRKKDKKIRNYELEESRRNLLLTRMRQKTENKDIIDSNSEFEEIIKIPAKIKLKKRSVSKSRKSKIRHKKTQTGLNQRLKKKLGQEAEETRDRNCKSNILRGESKTKKTKQILRKSFKNQLIANKIKNKKSKKSQIEVNASPQIQKKKLNQKENYASNFRLESKIRTQKTQSKIGNRRSKSKLKHRNPSKKKQIKKQPLRKDCPAKREIPLSPINYRNNYESQVCMINTEENVLEDDQSRFFSHFNSHLTTQKNLDIDIPLEPSVFDLLGRQNRKFEKTEENEVEYSRNNMKAKNSKVSRIGSKAKKKKNQKKKVKRGRSRKLLKKTISPKKKIKREERLEKFANKNFDFFSRKAKTKQSKKTKANKHTSKENDQIFDFIDNVGRAAKNRGILGANSTQTVPSKKTRIQSKSKISKNLKRNKSKGKVFKNRQRKNKIRKSKPPKKSNKNQNLLELHCKKNISQKLKLKSSNENLKENIFSVPENYFLTTGGIKKSNETNFGGNFSIQNKTKLGLKVQMEKFENIYSKGKDNTEIVNKKKKEIDMKKKETPELQNENHNDEKPQLEKNREEAFRSTSPAQLNIEKTKNPESLLKRNKSLRKIAKIAAKLKQNSKKYELGADFKDLLHRLGELAGEVGVSDDTQNSGNTRSKFTGSRAQSSGINGSKESEKQSKNSGSTNVHNYNINNYQNINNIKNLK